jgi:hypothetical protein
MKATFLSAFFTILYVYSSESIAQKKAIQPKWVSIQTYDSLSMENQKGDVAIKEINSFLKGACSADDPVETKELMEQIHSSPIIVELEDGPLDSGGRILSAKLTTSYKSYIYVSNIPIPYSRKLTEIKFYRDRSECIKERESFRQWLIERNKEYRSSIGKYQ